MTSNTNTLHH